MENVYEPELIDVLNLLKIDILNSMNCHHVARIQSYEPASKTCKATIVYKKTITKNVNGKQTEVLQDYPVLVSCPVINHGGGKGGLRFPIAKDDVALIFFNDKDLDNWFIGKQANGATNTKRSHNFSDGVALVGLFSKNDALKDNQKFPTENGRTLLFGENAGVSLGDTTVKIFNQVESLGVIIQDLLNIVKVLAPTSTAPTNPTIPNPAQTAAITAIQVRLQGLLK